MVEGTLFPDVSVFEPLLDRGEKVLWSGQPKQGLLLQAQDVFMIPFSLMWGGFAFFWEAGVLGLIHTSHPAQGPVSVFFSLWGIPFVAVGAYMIMGRFFYDAIARNRTYYAITNERAIIFKTLFIRKIQSFDYATLASLNLVERGDGSGDILFGTPSAMSSFSGAGWPGSGKYAVPGFYLLPGAREVYNQIRSARK